MNLPSVALRTDDSEKNEFVARIARYGSVVVVSLHEY